MSAEAPFNKAAAEFITQVTDLVPPPPDASPIEFQHPFASELTGQRGFVAVWVGISREIRISATTMRDGGIKPQFTTITVRDAVGETPAEAFFKRRNFPDLPDVEADGLAAINHGGTLLDNLQ